MPSSRDLRGLMKFLNRDKWYECFQEVFDEHFGPALDEEDMVFEDIVEILGEDCAITLWGCAFEDFLTRGFEVEGGNIVDEYLKRRGWKENAQAKAYMRALRASIMSLYEVTDVVPGSSLMARDLIRGGEPIAVNETTATKTLKQWDRIAARIVPVTGRNVLAAGLLPFTLQAADELVEDLRQLFGKGKERKLTLVKDEDLQAAASMFTNSWLFDTLEQTIAMAIPALRNADDDDLVFHDVRFPLTSGATQKQIGARLNTIAGMVQEDTKFWNWVEGKPATEGRKSTGITFDTTMDNGLQVLGNVELKGRFLNLATNSAARAASGTALIQQALGNLVGTPLTEIRTVEQMIAEPPAQDQVGTGSDIQPEIAEQIIHQFMDQQYRETLDQPVGMLGNKTPRQTAKSASGRKKVANWLKYLENQTAKRPNSADPLATYSFEWMWHELGVADLRR